MANNTKTVAPATPTFMAKANFRELFAKIFDEKGKLKEGSLQTLTTEELTGFFVYMSKLSKQYADLAALASAIMNSKDSSQFGGENSLVSVFDEERGESIGAAWVRTETSTTPSTANAKNRLQVISALDPSITGEEDLNDIGAKLNEAWQEAHPKLGKYTKISIELQKEPLFRDKKNGLLDPSVAILLSEKVSTKRTSSFKEAVKAAVEEN